MWGQMDVGTYELNGSIEWGLFSYIHTEREREILPSSVAPRSLPLCLVTLPLPRLSFSGLCQVYVEILPLTLGYMVRD